MTQALDTAVADVDGRAGIDTARERTLAGAHALLMRDVARRAAPVLALLDVRAWPHAELGTLTAFLRGELLRRVRAEESELYPDESSVPPFAELSADHARLHELTAHLERVRAEPCPPAQLRAVVTELLGTLHRHLRDEQDVLAALSGAESDVPGLTGPTTAGAVRSH
jgi:hypothetical protein